MHRFIPDPSEALDRLAQTPAGRDRGQAGDHVAAIKRWTRELLRLPADAVVIVSETACADAGCPLVETMVAVFEDTGSRSWKLVRPRVAVTKLMLQQTLVTPPACAQARPGLTRLLR